MIFYLENRSVVRIQGGYFFMYFKISFTAVKTIAKASNVITSTIYQYTPPFYKGAETAATASLQIYYSIMHSVVQV